jgi:hypothetical protein
MAPTGYSFSGTGETELAAAEHLLSTFSVPSQGIKFLYNYSFWKDLRFGKAVEIGETGLQAMVRQYVCIRVHTHSTVQFEYKDLLCSLVQLGVEEYCHMLVLVHQMDERLPIHILNKHEQSFYSPARYSTKSM